MSQALTECRCLHLLAAELNSSEVVGARGIFLRRERSEVQVAVAVDAPDARLPLAMLVVACGNGVARTVSILTHDMHIQHETRICIVYNGSILQSFQPGRLRGWQTVWSWNRRRTGDAAELGAAAGEAGTIALEHGYHLLTCHAAQLLDFGSVVALGELRSEQN